jgi:threonine/homoserine/homoserine lactone efflux protein
LALSGFVFNASQPTILAFWIGVATHADSTYPGQVEVYIVAALLTVVAVDLLKSALGHKLAVLLTDNMLKWANRVFGVLLIVFGFFVALQAFVR